MNQFPYMPLYWNDLLSDNKVRIMSNDELGAYVRLLGAAWHEDIPGTLPDNEDDLCRFACVEPSLWRKLSRRVLACFVLDGNSGRYVQKRMVREHAICVEQADMKHARATAGAQKRWGIKPRKSKANAKAMLKHGFSNASHSQNQSQNLPPTTLPPAVGAASGSPPTVSHEDWIKSLSEDPTYAGIDVGRELGKMKRWCEQNSKPASRKRFINWLNRADAPMSDAPMNGHSSPNNRQEIPPEFLAWFGETHPQKTLPGETWKDVPEYLKSDWRKAQKT